MFYIRSTIFRANLVKYKDGLIQQGVVKTSFTIGFKFKQSLFDIEWGDETFFLGKYKFDDKRCYLEILLMKKDIALVINVLF